MQAHLTSRFVAIALFAATAALTACTDPVADGDPAVIESSLPRAQSVSSHRMRVIFEGAIITDFPVGRACFQLNGSVTVISPFGGASTTYTQSDCHWNEEEQMCDCTVSASQDTP